MVNDPEKCGALPSCSPAPLQQARGALPRCPWREAGDGNPQIPAGPSTTGVPAMVPGWVAASLHLDISSSLDIYSVARNEREEVDDNMFPVLCFVQRSSRQHVCVCGGLRVLLSAASKQGSSQFSKAYSPPSNTALALETVHGFDTPVGFLPTSLCQRYLGMSGRLCLAPAGGKQSPSQSPWGWAGPQGPAGSCPWLGWGDRLGLQHSPAPQTSLAVAWPQSHSLLGTQAAAF